MLLLFFSVVFVVLLPLVGLGLKATSGKHLLDLLTARPAPRPPHTHPSRRPPVSMVYRRRRVIRVARCGAAPGRSADQPASRPSSSGRFSIAQRTRHLMRSNMFASVTRQARARGGQHQAAPAAPPPAAGPSQTSSSSLSSSLASVTHLAAHLRAPDRKGADQTETTSAKTLDLGHSHQLGLAQSGTAAKSAWSKHLKPVLRRSTPVQQQQQQQQTDGTGRVFKSGAFAAAAAAAGLTHQSAAALHSGQIEGANYVNKYVVRGSAVGNGLHCAVPPAGANLEAPRGGRCAGRHGHRQQQQPDKCGATAANPHHLTNNDGTLASNSDSDIRTLNTRLQKAAAYLQHEPRPSRQESHGNGKHLLQPPQPPPPPPPNVDLAHLSRKQHQPSRRAH